MRLFLQTEGEDNMQAEPVPCGVEPFDLEGEAPVAAKGFPSEVDGLGDSGWTGRVQAFHVDTGTPGIAFPLDEVTPDQLNRRGNDSDRTD